MRLFLGIFAVILISACATTPIPDDRKRTISFETDFEGARLNGVRQDKDGRYILSLKPENIPINNSAWYGFDIVGAKGQAVPMTLEYTDGTHRYIPKVELQSGDWAVFDGVIDVSDDKSTARFSITPERNRVRVASQPVFDTNDHKLWIDQMTTLKFVTQSEIGKSVESRSIYMLEETDEPDGQTEKPYIVIVGRQHPPETTGAHALQPFVEAIWGEGTLASEFRKNFNLIVIPLVNPDGVVNGHWRHNVNGIDLNRDWGPFTQPETKAVETELRRFKSGDDDIVLFLDFHSTWRNLIYTQPDSEPTVPANFTLNWVKSVKDNLPKESYDFTREASPTTDRPVSKNYMYNTYKIPAITFEVGDKTDERDIDLAGKTFAEEMMKLLLK